MVNFEDYVNENKTEHDENWSYIPDKPYRILIIRGPGSGKTNVLLNLIENQLDIDKIYLYAKGPYEAKYQYLINKREDVGISLISIKNVPLNHIRFLLMTLHLHQIILYGLESYFQNVIKIMTINDQIRVRNCDMILIEKQPKYQLYHQIKCINMNLLLVKIYYHLISNK